MHRSLGFSTAPWQLYTFSMLLPVSGGIRILKHRVSMIDLPTYPLRIFFIVALLILLAAGVWLVKHQDSLFGKDANMSETSGERFYSKTQMWICWLLGVKVCATLIFLL